LITFISKIQYKSDKKLQDLKKRINSSKPPVIENEKIRNILAKRRLDQSFLNQKRRSFEENSSKPGSDQVRLMVNNPATEQTASISLFFFLFYLFFIRQANLM
jgi:hypothetical protein